MKSRYEILKRCVLLTVWTLFFYPTVAQDTLTVASDPRAVILFYSGAQVTEEIEVETNNQELILHVQNLPLDIDLNRISTTVKGGFDVIEVDHSYYLPNVESTEFNKESDVFDDLRYELDELYRERDVYLVERNMIYENKKIENTAQGSLPKDLAALSDFYRTKLMEINERLSDVDKRIDAKVNEIDEQSKKLLEVQSRDSRPYLNLFISIRSDEPIRGELILDYFVSQAGWNPNYDFRATGISDSIRIDYKAEIFQSTGHDWEDVKITLSQANPEARAVKPTVMIWRLDKPFPYERSTSTQPGSISGTVTGKNGLVIPNSLVSLMYSNRIINSQMTTSSGGFSFRELPPGNYQLFIRAFGYEDQTKPVSARANSNTHTQVDLRWRGEVYNGQLEEEIMREVVYEAPQAVTSGEGLTSLPQRDVASIASNAAGVYQIDYGTGINIRGGRRGATDVYIDGLKVRGVSSLPQSAMSRNGNWTTAAPFKVVSAEPIELKETPSGLEFTLENKISLSSNGKDRNIRYLAVEIKSEFIHHLFPMIDNDAFVEATIPEFRTLGLVDANINLYFDGKFVGEAQLIIQEFGDTLYIPMGRDKGITMRKTTVDAQRIKNFMQSIRYVVTQKIEIRNDKARTVQLVIHDQIPVTFDERISINFVGEMDGKHNVQSGEITWEFDLESNSKWNREYTYEIKY